MGVFGDGCWCSRFPAASWRVQHESGYSVTKLHDQSAIGFLADKVGSLLRGTGWNTVPGWSTSKTTSQPLWNSGSFNPESGVFTAPVEGGARVFI